MGHRVIGFKPPDEKWEKMKAVYDSCKGAKIDPPDEVSRFFNYHAPDSRGVEVNQEDLGEAVKKYVGDMEDGFEVFLDKLPKDVKVIRFFNIY